MRSTRRWLGLAAAAGIIASACSGSAAPTAGPAAAVRLQLQWAPQAQFAGYFAADKEGYYKAEGLTVTMVPGGPDVVPQQVGSAANGPEFTISWVPKVLEAREQSSDLVDIAQIFQRSGTKSVSWKETGITKPADFSGKKIGVWDFGNEYEVTAAAKKAGLTPGAGFTKVIQPFDMSLLINKQIDVAEAMIYNEYAQLLEATDPATGDLYKAADLNVIDYNQVGTAMLQDSIYARAAWLKVPANQATTVKFLKATFEGWIYCRDHPDDCVGYVMAAGPTLGKGHQAWQLNEVNPLIWPSPNGIGIVDPTAWATTVAVAKAGKVLTKDPDPGAYDMSYATQALSQITDDTKGTSFVKGTVEVTKGGE
jgi:NitT/TauT family transport system substrate-binding protein